MPFSVALRELVARFLDVKDLLGLIEERRGDVDETRHALETVSYTHLRAHETSLHLVCRLLLEKKKK